MGISHPFPAQVLVRKHDEAPSETLVSLIIPPAALPSPFPGDASALARVAPIRKDTHEVRLLWPLGYSLRPPASCGRDDFREILTGKTMNNRYRRTW